MQLERFHYKHLFLTAIFFLFLLSSAFILGTWLVTDNPDDQFEKIEQILDSADGNSAEPQPSFAPDKTNTQSTQKPLVGNKSNANGVTSYGWNRNQPSFPWCYQSFSINPKSLDPIAQNSALTSSPIEQISSDLFALVIPKTAIDKIPMSQNLGKKLADGSIHIGPLLPKAHAQEYLKTMDSTISPYIKLIAQNRTQTISQISYALHDNDSYQIISSWMKKMPQITTVPISCVQMMKYKPQQPAMTK